MPHKDQQSIIRSAILDSVYNHALLYLDGHATTPDPRIAAQKFKKAADHGHAASAHMLAELYQTGRGVGVKDLKESVLLYSKAVRAGYPKSMAALGRCYRFGCGLQKDVQQAVKLFTSAADRNCFEGMVGLADCYRDGAGVHADPNHAVSLYNEAAKRGCALAHFRLGECYRDGIGVACDFKSAYVWFQSAEAHNEKAAYYELARCCAQGKGTAKDLQQAFAYLLQAADEANDRDALYAVATFYATGNVISTNWAKAGRYFRKAAEMEHPKSMLALADCYMSGHGLLRDPKQAFLWYRAAQENGEIEGFLGQAECYLDGEGVEKDEIKALYLFANAIERGSHQASLHLARRYLNGIGVKKSMSEALRYFTAAANLGSAEAHLELGRYLMKSAAAADRPRAAEHFKHAHHMGSVKAGVHLAICLIRGTGVKPDAVEAFQLLLNLAPSGNEDARLSLADCYFFGKGCKADPANGVRLLQQLSDQRHVLATRRLARCYYMGIGIKQDYSRAAMLYEKASNLGDIVAKLWLGTCYRHGHGVEKDPKRAFVLYKSAADAGNQVALINLALCYERGIGVECDWKSAVLLYEKAVGNGAVNALGSLFSTYEKVDSDVQIASREAIYLRRLLGKKSHRRRTYRLACLYLKGLGVPEDPAKAHELINGILTEERTCYALRFLAYCHMHGKGVPRDHDKAVNLLYESIQKGSKRAKLMLGKSLIEGLAGERKEGKGLQLIEDACNEGSMDAALLLGDRMYQGHMRYGDNKYCPIQRNYDVAVQLYRRAGLRADSLFRLSKCFMHGTGVEKSVPRALQLLSRSASMGYSYAQLLMAQYYTHGVHTMSKNYEMALKLYEGAVHRVNRRARGRAMHKFAAFLGSHGMATSSYHSTDKLDERVNSLLEEAARGSTAEAVNDLAVIIERRKHRVEEDEEDADTESTAKAFDLFRQASATLPRAQANIGICYEMGIGICRDMTQARLYYGKAILQMDAVAMNNLALCLIEDKEYAKAVDYLKRSMSKGEASAFVNMGWLLERGQGVDKNVDEAFGLYQKAARMSNAEGCLNLAACYEKEIGTQYDGEQAKHNYQKAIDLGSAEARDRLKMYTEQRVQL